MTKEETISNLKAYLDGDTAIGNIIPLRSVLESAVKYLEPSLPSNLDEAAGDYIFIHEHAPSTGNHPLADAFKAGAEWMAGQGVTTEQIVGRTPLNGPNGITVFLYDFDGFEAGDKVIVQIRKK